MPKTTRTDEANVSPDAALNASMAWIDLNTRWIEQWSDWQRAFWQPLVDQQARWFDYCQQLCGGQPTERGAEQLG